MIEGIAISAFCALSLLSAVFYRSRFSKKPWSFLTRWRLTKTTTHSTLASSLYSGKGDHPMASLHLEAMCQDDFKGVKDPEIAREPAGAFSHLESILNRIQARFLPHHSLSSKMLLGDTLIDQKAFMDCFRSEKEAIVALYHCNEERVIFVSANVKKMLGYSPGDFRIHFYDILHDQEAWRNLLSELRSRHKIYAPLALHRLAESPTGSLCAWDAYLGYVQRGSTHYAVMLLYPAFCQLKR